ncbi:MAG: 50S ribosomal protein L10 [Limisphaerales bacterium]
MRPEKKAISAEYIARLNASPYFVVAEYTGLKVAQFTELRRRLRAAGARAQVVKNSIFRIAAKEAGAADLTGTLSGQVAVITGDRDISAAAKVLKNFTAEFDKPKVKFGFLGNQRLDEAALKVLADLPPIEVLRGKLLGVLQAPAQQLVALLSTPASQLARVLKAKAEKA